VQTTQTLVIGGGISGLAVAQALEDAGRDYLLVEARARYGGRIVSHAQGAARFDLGPAWIWPGQPRIAALIARMGIADFAQFSEGAHLFEVAQGRVMQGHGPAAMADARRLTGGLAALTGALAQSLPAARKRSGTAVTALHRSDGQITATLSSGARIVALRVVLALPPRLAARITQTPALPETARNALCAVPTWMAGQAKALALYDSPFWRTAGLSGDAMSRRGPMVEIHDACPATGGPYALFGFIGVPPDARHDAAALRTSIRAQLVRLFGPQAADPTALVIKDWARAPYTATAADRLPLHAHPAYGMPTALQGLRQAGLYLAGSEVAPQWGGYIEGALDAAAAALDALAEDSGWSRT